MTTPSRLRLSPLAQQHHDARAGKRAKENTKRAMISKDVRRAPPRKPCPRLPDAKVFLSRAEPTDHDFICDISYHDVSNVNYPKRRDVEGIVFNQHGKELSFLDFSSEWCTVEHVETLKHWDTVMPLPFYCGINNIPHARFIRTMKTMYMYGITGTIIVPPVYTIRKFKINHKHDRQYNVRRWRAFIGKHNGRT